MDWANASRNVLHSVLDRLFPFCEYTRFSVVCKRWFSVAFENYEKLQQSYGPRHQFPLLVIPTEDYDPNTRRLYSFMTDKVCDFELPVPSYSIQATGCSNGWNATWNKDMVITLFNPTARKAFCLPPLRKTHKSAPARAFQYTVQKVIISSRIASSAVHSSNYVVAAIHGPVRSLAYIKSGDDYWTYVPLRLHGFGKIDIIFHKGHLLALSRWHMLMSIDLSSDSVGCPQPKFISAPFSSGTWLAYLAESSTGDVLFLRILKEHVSIRQSTEKFRVFRLNRSPTVVRSYDELLKSQGDGRSGWNEVGIASVTRLHSWVITIPCVAEHLIFLAADPTVFFIPTIIYPRKNLFNLWTLVFLTWTMEVLCDTMRQILQRRQAGLFHFGSSSHCLLSATSKDWFI